MAKLELSDVFDLFDDEGDEKIDGSQIGDVIRAMGCKPTNEVITKAVGKEYKKGEKRLDMNEFKGFYDKVSKEKDTGSKNDYIEGLRVFDKEGKGLIPAAEVRHCLMGLGERLDKESVDLLTEGLEDADGMIKYHAFVERIMTAPGEEQAAS